MAVHWTRYGYRCVRCGAFVSLDDRGRPACGCGLEAWADDDERRDQYLAAAGSGTYPEPGARRRRELERG